MTQPCTAEVCGRATGAYRYALADAAGIFCTYVCEHCEAEKRAKYNSAIFENGTYAMTGDEDDIGYDD